MFEYIRTHQKLMQFVLLLLIIPSFVLVGISGYLGQDDADVLVKVDAEKITQQQFDRLLRNQIEQMRTQFQGQFDESTFNTLPVKKALLEKLIGEYLLRAEVKKEQLTVSDASLQKNILAIPSLTLPDGAFDYQGYKRILAEQGLTPERYENDLRQDLAKQQLISTIEKSTFVPQTVLAQLERLQNQSREIQALTFHAADFLSEATVTDAMLQGYYTSHPNDFTTPETAVVSYVVLSLDNIIAHTTVSDEELRHFYEKNIKKYHTEEQRQVSHILIKIAKNASAKDRDAAYAKAKEVASLAKKSPEQFAQLAKQYSQDEGSAQNGGNLGFINKGVMVKPFEDAAFQLKIGEVSPVVTTDFGYHVLLVSAIKPAQTQSFEAVKNQIQAELTEQKARQMYAQMAETFTNTVYEQPDSLDDVAQKLKLTIEKAGPFTRHPDLARFTAVNRMIFSHAKLLEAIFSDDSIKNKRNTEAIEIAPNILVAAHVDTYTPAIKKPFDQVKSSVTTAVKWAEATRLATQAGEARQQALKNKDDLSGFKTIKWVSRRQTEGLSPLAVSDIMKANVTHLPAFVGVSEPGVGYTLYRINKVAEHVGTQEQTARLRSEVESLYALNNLYNFIAFLKSRANIQFVRPL